MLEAGRSYDPVRRRRCSSPDHAPLRGAGTPEKPFGFYDATVDGGWEVPGEPYTSARARRSSSTGGGRACWAAEPITGAGSRFAMGPTTSSPTRVTARIRLADYYDDLAPYYDKVEMLIGVYGTNKVWRIRRIPDGRPPAAADTARSASSSRRSSRSSAFRSSRSIARY